MYRWAVAAKHLSVDDDMGYYGIILPNILGIILIQWRNPYQPTSMMEWEREVERCSNMYTNA